MQPSFDRRRFMALGAASLLSAGVESSRGFAANDTINVACLGTGGRCQKLMQELKNVPGVRLAAVCDAWDVHRDKAKTIADANAIVANDYRSLLERQDIDAVLIGSPDHWHVPMTIDACEAGKDVYVEKPLTHDLSEGPRMIEVERRTKRIVQVGTQQRSMPHLIEAREIVRAGTLGDIHKIHCTWNRNQNRWNRNSPDVDPSSVRWQDFLGNAPDQPFNAYRFRNWRWFWDFGGGIFTDLMVHWMDTAFWMLDMPVPATANSIGDFVAAADLWETPDTVQTLLHFPEQKLQAYFEGTFVNHHNRAMLELMGTEATLYCDRGRYEIIPQRGSKVEAKVRNDDPAGERGWDFAAGVNGELFHLTNWVDCIRTRKPASCPAAEGVRSAAAAHLANIALRTGQTARWALSQ